MDINSSSLKRWVKRKIAWTTAQQPKQFIMCLKNTSQSSRQLQRGPRHCQKCSPRSQLLLEKHISQLGIWAPWLLSREVEEEWASGQPGITKAWHSEDGPASPSCFKTHCSSSKAGCCNYPLLGNPVRRIKDSGLIFHQLLCKMLHTKSQVDILFSEDMGRRHWRSFLWGLQGTPSRGQYKCILTFLHATHVGPALV